MPAVRALGPVVLDDRAIRHLGPARADLQDRRRLPVRHRERLQPVGAGDRRHGPQPRQLRTVGLRRAVARRQVRIGRGGLRRRLRPRGRDGAAPGGDRRHRRGRVASARPADDPAGPDDHRLRVLRGPDPRPRAVCLPVLRAGVILAAVSWRWRIAYVVGVGHDLPEHVRRPDDAVLGQPGGPRLARDRAGDPDRDRSGADRDRERHPHGLADRPAPLERTGAPGCRPGRRRSPARAVERPEPEWSPAWDGGGRRRLHRRPRSPMRALPRRRPRRPASSPPAVGDDARLARAPDRRGRRGRRVVPGPARDAPDPAGPLRGARSGSVAGVSTGWTCGSWSSSSSPRWGCGRSGWPSPIRCTSTRSTTLGRRPSSCRAGGTASTHDIYEWTHPHLAKYAMAGGIVLWGQDEVSATSELGTPVTATVVEPRRDDRLAGGRAGERLHVATGTEIHTFDLRTRQLIGVMAAPGATALAMSDPGPSSSSASTTAGWGRSTSNRSGSAGPDVGPHADRPRVAASARAWTSSWRSTTGSASMVASGDRRSDGGRRLRRRDGRPWTCPARGPRAGRHRVGARGDAVRDGRPGDRGGRPRRPHRRRCGSHRSQAPRRQRARSCWAARATPRRARTSSSRSDDGTLPGIVITEVARVAVATAEGVTFVDPASGAVIVLTVPETGGAHGLALVTGLDDPKIYATVGGAGRPRNTTSSPSAGDQAKDGPVSTGHDPLPAPGTEVDLRQRDAADPHPRPGARTQGRRVHGRSTSIEPAGNHANAVYRRRAAARTASCPSRSRRTSSPSIRPRTASNSCSSRVRVVGVDRRRLARLRLALPRVSSRARSRRRCCSC